MRATESRPTSDGQSDGVYTSVRAAGRTSSPRLADLACRDCVLVADRRALYWTTLAPNPRTRRARRHQPGHGRLAGHVLPILDSAHGPHRMVDRALGFRGARLVEAARPARRADARGRRPAVPVCLGGRPCPGTRE